MKYLVTDDSKLARRRLVKSLLAYADEKDIFEATNGLEAIQLVLKERPDVVFLDLTMPEMNGYDALPKFFKIKPDMKVIVVSADVQEQAKERVLELGAKLHVNKPITEEKIKDILESL